MWACAHLASVLAALPLAWSLSMSSSVNEATVAPLRTSALAPPLPVQAEPKLQNRNLRNVANIGFVAHLLAGRHDAFLQAMTVMERSSNPTRTFMWVLLILGPLVSVFLLAWAMQSGQGGGKSADAELSRQPRSRNVQSPEASAASTVPSSAPASSLLSMFSPPPKEHRHRQDPCETRQNEPHVSMFLGVSDYEVLCPELVVRQPAGISMELSGTLGAYQQEDMLSLCLLESSDKQAVLHCYMSEQTTADKGVLVETSLKQFVAFLHTEAAVGSKGRSSSRADRHVSIVRPGASGNIFSSSFMGGSSSREPPFAVVHEEEGSSCHFIMRHCTRSGDPGPVIFHIYQSHSGLFNIVDEGGALVATSQEDTEHSWIRSRTARRVLRMGPGADTGMIVCGIIAVHKLA
mmetsp:Transcript_124578/g.265690  ORF Transcript_124578/g.265690 Transcript_124578/m.265690 type:complete len:405 (-) Transcript_124578:40-1254(-)